MDAMLQRHNAKFIYAVPDGLREIMSDISREVLRSQPKHVYTFIADYLDALLITRENARIAARLVENIADIASTIANFLEGAGMTRDHANKTVIILQTAFRKYLSVRPKARPNEQMEEEEFLAEVMDNIKIMPEKAEEAAISIQNAYRQFKERQEKQREVLKGVIDWRIAARSAIYLYKKTGVTKEEANRAATLIKAAYKGYYTRRTMRRIAEQSRMEEVEPEETLEEEILYEEIEDEYIRDEEMGYEEEPEGVEEGKVAEMEEAIVAETNSGLVVAERLMEQILERVAQIAETVAAPPPSPTEPSVEATTIDLLEGDTTGGETSEVTEN